jgi:Zn-dependent protease with chaperone function
VNFFEAQRAARSQSKRLTLLFALAVVLIVLAINAIALFALGLQTPTPAVELGFWGLARNHIGLLFLTTLATLGVIGISSLIKIATLRQGGGAVARQLGGVPVSQDTTDLSLRRLRNVVEEIAIASGTPVPEIYVLEQEAGINAFAAGYAPADAAIAVTRGALDRLNRNELQGVIAHEFSHILNGDMRLNIRLMGLLFGILVLGIGARRILMHSRGGRDSRGAGAILLIALGVMIVGYIGVFFGRLIKAGVSRQREFLADASAVQFTRQTDGLVGALKKVAGLPDGSHLESAGTEEVSHMLFGDGVGYSSLFATHPPLLQRIQALDRSFKPESLKGLKQQWAIAPPNGLAEDLVLGLVDPAAHAGASGAAPPPVPSAASSAPPPIPQLPAALAELDIEAAAVADQVAHPDAGDYLRAEAITAALPEALRRAASLPASAVGVVLGLLLDPRPALRAQQLRSIGEALDAQTAGAAESFSAACSGLHPALRLPLAQIAFPALRRRPRAELHRVVDCIEALIHADGQVGLFEFCLGRLFNRLVIEALDPSRHRPAGRLKLHALRNEVTALFGVLAQHGHADAASAQRAFAAGLRVLYQGEAQRYAPPADWVAALDATLPRLDQLDLTGKELLIEGLVAACSHDGRISLAEAELVRTVCGLLHLPLPPLLEH